MNNSNIQEVDNIVPTLQKEVFRSADRSTVVRLRQIAYEVCRAQIPDTYIKQAFNKFRRGVVFRDNEGNTICFALWVEQDLLDILHKSRKYMYVLLICGRKEPYKIGNIIFPFLIDYCKENNINFLRLVPANNKLRAEYQSYGFVDVPGGVDSMNMTIVPLKLRPKKYTYKNTNGRRNTRKLTIPDAPELEPTIEHINGEFQ